MNFPSSEFDAAVAAVCHGTATDADLAALYALLRIDSAARDEYVWQIELHARLAMVDWVPGAPVREVSSPGKRGTKAALTFRAKVALILVGVAAAVFVALKFGPLRWPSGQAEPVLAAHFGELQHARWVAAHVEHRQGEAIQAGQRLELSGGLASIEFASGATALLQGPAIFEVQSDNAGFLVLGRVTVIAATSRSKGFTVHTRTARAVDLGTEFTAEATADGLSWFGVISGAVEVHRHGIAAPQHLGKGEMLSLEAGRQQVMVRVERGDETPAFRFPTIEPPSDRDYADARQGTARLSVVQGNLKRTKAGSNSGPVAVLLDGRGQSGPDVPEESVFFQNETTGRLLMDLGRPVAVTRINTYSWHQNGLEPGNRLRALQNYALYGFAGETPPATDGDLDQAGWAPIARVNTDEFFRVVERLDRPAQQACSITSATGALGRYRYLLWHVQPSRHPDFKHLNNSFYGEFDVYAQP